MIRMIRGTCSWMIGLLILYQIGSHPVAASDSESIESELLEAELLETRSQLRQCLERLKELETLAGQPASGSYLGHVYQWMTASPSQAAKMGLKTTVHNFLRATQLDQVPLSAEHPGKEVHLKIFLTNEDLITLRRFLLNDEGSEAMIQAILHRSYQVEAPGFTWDHLELGLILQVSLVAGLVGLLLFRGVAVWRVSLVLMVASVAWTWVHLYKMALAKKAATLSRLKSVPRQCLIEKQGWSGAFTDAFNHMLGLPNRHCEDYYEALMVDAFWEVTPLKAVSETASQFVLRPLEVMGSSLGVFFRDVLAPLPWIWQIPVLIVTTILLVFVLLMGCGYQIKSPWLFSLEPSRPRQPPTLEHLGPLERLPYPTDPHHLDRMLDNPRASSHY